MVFLEVAIFNYESAVAAKNGGANRLEVCENYAIGGLTPSFNLVFNLKKLGGTDVFIMIREESEGFQYTIASMDKMLKDIEVFKAMGVDGFVYGGLDEAKNVHKEFSKDIIKAADPFPVTFHRAIDLCKDMNKATEDVIECGFKRILTSGGKNNAYEGRFVIRDLINRYGKEIIIMPGGGIRKNNINEIKEITKAKEFHTAGLKEIRDGFDTLTDENEIIEIKKRLN